MPFGSFEGGDHAALLARPRVLEEISAALAAPFVLLGGPVGIGRTTALAQWSKASGAPWVHEDPLHSAAQVVAEAAQLLQAQHHLSVRVPLVVATRIDRPDLADLLHELHELAERSPRRVVGVVGGTAALTRDLRTLEMALPAGLPSRSVRVVSPRVLLLTATEIHGLAQLRGAPITDRDAASIRSVTGGNAAVVVRVLDRLVSQAGGPSDQARWAAEAADAFADVAARNGLRQLVPPELTEMLGRLALAESVPSSTADELARRLGTPMAIRDLLGSGLLALWAEEQGVAVVPGLRWVLTRDQGADLGDPTGSDRALDLAQALWDTQRPLDGVALLEAGGRRSALVRLLEANLTTICQLQADRLGRLLTPDELARHPRLTLAVARAAVDLTQTGHAESVSSAAARRALALVEAAEAALERVSGDSDGEQSDGEQSDGEQARRRDRAVALIVRGVAARVDGAHERSEEHLAAAVAHASEGGDQELLASTLAQHAITHLSLGHYPQVQRAFLDAAELGSDGTAVRLARAGVEFVARSVDVPRWRPQEDRSPEWVDVAPSARLRSYGRAFRLVSALRTVEAAAELRVGFGPYGSDPDVEPLVIDVLRLNLDSVIGLVAGAPDPALLGLDLFGAAMARRAFSGYELSLLRSLRAELLSSRGDVEAAEALLVGVEPRHTVEQRVWTRLLWESGRAAEARELLDAVVTDPGLYEQRHAVWALVQHALVARDLGDLRASSTSLARAVSLAARTESMIPFARYGRSTMVGLLRQAGELALDHDSSAHVRSMEAALGRLIGPVLPRELTDRELVVLDALAGAPDVRGLAEQLFVSPNTVKSQLRQIYRKLGVSGWEDAALIGRVHRETLDP